MKLIPKLLLLTLVLAMFQCGGCIIGYKPPADSILKVDPGTQGKPFEFGLTDVVWDELQYGYGAIGFSSHPRAHEGYFFFGYDPGQSTSTYAKLSVLITPADKKPSELYKVELLLPGQDPEYKADIYCAYTGFASAPEKEDGRLVFRLQGVWMERADKKPGGVRVSGKIVARRGDYQEFDKLLADWAERSEKK